jgi:hypothetical protein
VACRAMPSRTSHAVVRAPRDTSLLPSCGIVIRTTVCMGDRGKLCASLVHVEHRGALVRHRTREELSKTQVANSEDLIGPTVRKK